MTPLVVVHTGHHPRTAMTGIVVPVDAKEKSIVQSDPRGLKTLLECWSKKAWASSRNSKTNVMHSRFGRRSARARVLRITNDRESPSIPPNVRRDQGDEIDTGSREPCYAVAFPPCLIYSHDPLQYSADTDDIVPFETCSSIACPLVTVQSPALNLKRASRGDADGMDGILDKDDRRRHLSLVPVGLCRFRGLHLKRQPTLYSASSFKRAYIVLEYTWDDS
ncbi:hypothetical protein L210DRAFT_3630828 [Boletus edulis BED1]|uniref:Uncharacterized protein n=1 Tax=Boletus edulis BED1 TaxID=1328754 RepID=A0AAD4GEA1_BOLED|nr:hypothetical protein L210DRAFT_3630828 [Boletus edulis BED1]